ncbi:MAG: threonine synthase [Planctomycetes bacterium]|nr:threonine synthase [Planctomycetota bacterium]
MTAEWLECIACHAQFASTEVRYTCDCGALLSLERPAGFAAKLATRTFDARLASRDDVDRSGVWRFREAVLDVPTSAIVSHPEGATRLYRRPSLSAYAGVEPLAFKHEGENPTGSFKDRGMTVAVTQAVRLGARAVACASTGNTSSSLAAYAAQAGTRAIVFVPAGKISLGKLAQTLAYGALCLNVRGDFDAAMRLVNKACAKLDIYLLNSINPFRIEGQKTIVWELLQDRGWRAPDWIALPAGNLGNTSAFGKALREALEGGWIDRVPRIAAIQASGANPFSRGFAEDFRTRHRMKAETIASAIRIGDPVSWDKARAAIAETHGVVGEVTDAELLEAKRAIDEAGIGCEPASACSLAGVRKLRAAGTIRPSDDVVCVLTGHVLKDPDVVLHAPGIDRSSQTIEIDPTVAAVEAALANRL